MTTQAQKSLFKGKKHHFLHFFEENWSFLVLAGWKTCYEAFD